MRESVTGVSQRGVDKVSIAEGRMEAGKLHRLQMIRTQQMEGVSGRVSPASRVNAAGGAQHAVRQG